MENRKLRNFGVFSESEYKGKTLEEASKYAEDGGFIVRIVEQDGDVKMLDMSVRGDRLNFRVIGGFVTAAFGG
jgi:hypothetical protein